jgi:pimeloyl-ACP methyl ester carboxylesterase
MPALSLPGHRIASYDVVGTGDPLLCFPGGPGFPAVIVREDAELLADHFEVYLIDPPGKGSSTPAARREDYSHVGHARFYNEVREALGLGPVTVHGVSFGAISALTFAALFPEATIRCIGVSGFGIGVDVDAAEGGAAAAQMEGMLERHAGAEWYEEARRTLDAFTETALATDDPKIGRAHV